MGVLVFPVFLFMGVPVSLLFALDNVAHYNELVGSSTIKRKWFAVARGKIDAH